MRNFISIWKKTSLRKLFTFIAKAPDKTLLLFSFLHAVIWTLQGSIMKNVIPLDAVESVCWGSRMQWGYYKHPPLAAWLSFLAAYLTGYANWAQFFLDQICICAAVIFVYLTARLFFTKTRAAFAALALYFIHYYNPGTMTFCPNSLMIVFLPMMTFLFIRSLKSEKILNWIWFGFVSGLAFLGKYSCCFLLFAMFLAMVFHREWRKQFLKPGPYLAAACFVFTAAKHLIWLVQNDGVCLRYIERSVERVHSVSAWIINVLSVAGIAAYPFIAGACVLFICCLPRHFRRLRNEDSRREPLYVSLMLSVIPVLVIWFNAVLGRRVVGMWLSAMAPFAGIFAVSVFPFYLSKKSFRRLFLYAAALTSILLIGQTADLYYRPRAKIHLDPRELCDAADDFFGRYSKNPIEYAAGYRWEANILQYYHENHPLSVSREDVLTLEKFRDKWNIREILLIGDNEDLEECCRILNPAFASKRVSFSFSCK